MAVDLEKDYEKARASEGMYYSLSNQLCATVLQPDVGGYDAIAVIRKNSTFQVYVPFSFLLGLWSLAQAPGQEATARGQELASKAGVGGKETYSVLSMAKMLIKLPTLILAHLPMVQFWRQSWELT
ncbi:expressed unknown protein [Seminavis robusta]|uniref:Uncharacterized protein n=1 Tax=Seminavis robusta TaxID=568900 RepID=A0A9N8EYK4_9STRA|nr:expressed unknown protein [Seminavis robusta]|eukprot:Sro2109_g314940.1 n/a (126) ;mRNA; f:6352-6729